MKELRDWFYGLRPFWAALMSVLVGVAVALVLYQFLLFVPDPYFDWVFRAGMVALAALVIWQWISFELFRRRLRHRRCACGRPTDRWGVHEKPCLPYTRADMDAED